MTTRRRHGAPLPREDRISAESSLDRVRRSWAEPFRVHFPCRATHTRLQKQTRSCFAQQATHLMQCQHAAKFGQAWRWQPSGVLLLVWMQALALALPPGRQPVVELKELRPSTMEHLKATSTGLEDTMHRITEEFFTNLESGSASLLGQRDSLAKDKRRLRDIGWRVLAVATAVFDQMLQTGDVPPNFPSLAAACSAVRPLEVNAKGWRLVGLERLQDCKLDLSTALGAHPV